MALQVIDLHSEHQSIKEDQEESFVKPLLENHGGTTPELSQLMQQERLQAISGHYDRYRRAYIPPALHD